MLEAEWNQIENHHKIDYIAKPKSENLERPQYEGQDKKKRLIEMKPIQIPKRFKKFEDKVYEKQLKELTQILDDLP